MQTPRLDGLALSEHDVDFIVRTAEPDAIDSGRLKRLVREDSDFRKAMVGSDRVFRKVMQDDNIFVSISTPLFFEILLRHAEKDLKKTGHTMEDDPGGRVIVFDADRVADLLDREFVLNYLADMMSSFTRIEHHSFLVKVRPGIYRRVRFHDMDIDSLMSYCDMLDEEHRFFIYRRIADACLFMLGIFPDFIELDYRYPHSGGLRRARVPGHSRRSVQEYEQEGRKFYKLLAEHPMAERLGFTELFDIFRENIGVAKKPLNFVARNYLPCRKRRLFGVNPSVN